MNDDNAPLNGMPRVGSRRWIAWKLTQLAHRVYDAEYYEQIAITGPDGEDIIKFEIVADLYGAGVSMQEGNDKFDGYIVSWTDDYVPEWLTGGDA